MRKSDDTISRADAIEQIQVWAVNLANPKMLSREDAIYILESMPSAQPERMRGRWQEITESDCSGYDPVFAGYDDPVVGYVCSVCHEGYEKEVMGKTAWDYCPNCGSYNGGK